MENGSLSALSMTGHTHGVSPISPHSIPLLSHSNSHSHIRRSPPSIPNLTTSMTPGPPSYLSDAPATILPSRFPIAADTFNNNGNGNVLYHGHSFERPSTADTTLSTTSNGPPPPTIAPPSLESPFAYSYTNATPPAPPNRQVYQSWTSPPGTVQYPFKPYQPPPPTYLPPLNYYYRPHRLEDIAPRDMLLQIIQLFFDFVYPLTPCVHRPSFMADLASRREERDPLFFALVMSTVASTLVQVPRNYLPIVERKQVRRLAQLCHEASRHVTVAAYDPPNSTHVVIRYLSVPRFRSPPLVSLSESLTCTPSIAIQSTTSVRDTMLPRMHHSEKRLTLLSLSICTRRLRMRDSTQLRPRCDVVFSGYCSVVRLLYSIATPLRRPLIFRLSLADKSMSILLGRPICLRDEDCTLHFPKEVDDE
jgi:hypothetical protein